MTVCKAECPRVLHHVECLQLVLVDGLKDLANAARRPAGWMGG